MFILGVWRKLMSPNPRTKPEGSSLSLPQLDVWDPQVLLAPCVLVHAQSSTIQEFSIFLKPISSHTLVLSCCHFYFSLNPNSQSCITLQSCRCATFSGMSEPESEISLAPDCKEDPQNRQSFSCRGENRKESGLIQSKRVSIRKPHKAHGKPFASFSEIWIRLLLHYLQLWNPQV